MQTLTVSQKMALVSFFVNMSVLWFGSALINPTNLMSLIKGIMNGFTTLLFALLLSKEVNNG